MDPLTALSLAGTVIQFVDFGSKLVSAGRQLYKNGQLDIHAQAARAADDLLDYSVKLRRPLQTAESTRPLTEDEKALEKICQDCDVLAQSFLARLDRLKVPPQTKKGWKKGQKSKAWPSLRVALESLWTKEELQELGNKLQGYRQEMDSRILRSLRKAILSSRRLNFY